MAPNTEAQPRRSGRASKVDNFAPYTPQQASPSAEYMAEALFNHLVVDHTSSKGLKANINGTPEQLSLLRSEVGPGAYPGTKRYYPAGESRAYSLLYALSISLQGVAGFDQSSRAMLAMLVIEDYDDVIKKQTQEVRDEYKVWWKLIANMHPIQALAILKTHEMVYEANCTFELAFIRPQQPKKKKTADTNVIEYNIGVYTLESVEDMLPTDSNITRTIWLYHNAAAYGSAESCFSGLADPKLVTDALLNNGSDWKAPNSCTEPEAAWKKQRIPQYETRLRELCIWPGSRGPAMKVAELAVEKGISGPKLEGTIRERVKTALVFYFGKTVGEKCYSGWEAKEKTKGAENAAEDVAKIAGLNAGT